MIGGALKKIRIENHETLQSLAGKLGVSINYISMIERGKQPPSQRFLDSFIELFKESNLIELREEILKTEISEKQIKDLKESKDNEYYKKIADMLFSDLDTQTKKDILNFMLVQKENETFKKGTYNKNKKEFEKIKKLINEL